MQIKIFLLTTMFLGLFAINAAASCGCISPDTSWLATDQMLYDSLVQGFNENENVIIARIDSVIPLEWVAPCSTYDDSTTICLTPSVLPKPEIVYVTVESVLKGDSSLTSLVFNINVGCSKSFSEIKGISFLSFFDSLGSFLDLGIRSKGLCLNQETGYFVEAGLIEKRGWDGLPQVSVPLDSFLVKIAELVVVSGVEMPWIMGFEAEKVTLSPNPSNPTTTIRFQSKGQSDIRIYDLNGHLIRNWTPTTRAVVWKGRDRQGREVASGTYIVRVNVGERVMSKRIVLMR